VVGQRQFAQRGFVERALGGGVLHGGAARLGQAVVKALGQRAGVAVAGLARVLAGLVARHQFQHAQRQGRPAALDAVQRVQRQPAARCFGGQEEELVELLFRHRLEQREHRANGLAYARGRLRHQAGAGLRGFVDGFGQFALAGPEGGVGKFQCRQRRIARLAVGKLLRRPGQEALALRLKVFLERGGREMFGQRRFLRAGHVEVDEGEVDVGQLPVGAQQPAVNLQLRPVQVRGGCRPWRAGRRGRS
jgi:hypothetical protein